MTIFSMIVLGLTGLMLTLVGLMRIFKPAGSYCLQTYAEVPGADVAADADMFSEMRGMGVVTMLIGLVLLAGLGLPEARITGHTVGAVFFGGYAIGRIFSFGADGKPNKDLVNGLGAEVLFGVLHTVALGMALAA
jgi:hypothetical protein